MLPLYIQLEHLHLFAKEFVDGAGYKYKKVKSVSCDRRFEVWGVRSGSEGHGEEPYEFKQVVSFNNEQGYIECSCMKFIEVGILCSHCLQVLHACCVDKVLHQYVLKWWCKEIKEGEFNVIEKYVKSL